MVIKDKKAVLDLLARSKEVIITNKFAHHLVSVEDDVALRALNIEFIGESLGETLGEVELPTHWKRLLKRKDCPKYMKEISISKVNAYYPKLQLPEEEHWVSFEPSIPKN